MEIGVNGCKPAITVAELRSLQALKIPRQLQLPNKRHHLSVDRRRSTVFCILSIIGRWFGHNSGVQSASKGGLLEDGKLFRCGSDDRVLLVVGEDLSLAHRPGYWTLWLSATQRHLSARPRYLLYLAVYRVAAMLPRIAPVTAKVDCRLRERIIHRS